MNTRNCLILFYIAGLSLISYSCSTDDDNGEEKFTPQTYSVKGKVEKGPFVSGSTISIRPMNVKMQAIGEMYLSTIQDNVGNFNFGSKMFESPYAELMATGYFFNEVTGSLSSGTLNLRAIVDLSDESTVNVNILTHLKYQRVLNLIGEGLSFKKANEQAQLELFSAFGLQKYTGKEASRFSITDGTDESAALIAISSLVLVERSEASITEYLAALCNEFGKDGSFSEATKQIISEDKTKLSHRLSDIADNIIKRYNDLGVSVEVKNLAYYIDWDDDGTAGNETLKEGQEVIVEKTELLVPYEGGTYDIRITSPVPVYLNPIHTSNESSSELVDYKIYDEAANQDISLETSLAGNILTIKANQLYSRSSKSTDINLYDFLGNVLATITLTQEGNKDAALPGLGKDARGMVESYSSSLGKAVSYYNVLEQYYHYNATQADLVSQNVRPESNDISSAWNSFYYSLSMNRTLKKADSERLGIYQDYCNVFTALSYYYMVVAWGGVPYIKEYTNEIITGISRTDETEILNDLAGQLREAIPNLENKKNESLGDIDDFFFVSKDVACILLADIYMYQGRYDDAEEMWEKVISAGFYSLDASNYSEKQAIDNIVSNGSGNEIIFALKNLNENTPRSGGANNPISQAPLIPVFTYSDVMLSYAECLFKRGNATNAKIYLDKVASAKGITVSGDVIAGIADARRQRFLYCVGNFAFMKRNNIAKSNYQVQDYQLLFPIPDHEIYLNPNMTQNPGYY